VIIVIASRHDQAARTLVARQGTDNAVLLTCEDLSVPGWRHYVAAPGASVAVIGGREVPLEEITGVVSCLPSVSELELLHIVPADRAYVAAEMTAFLLSWLSALSCPVVNQPSPTCLSGPYWRPEQWAYFAAQAGMRVQAVQRRIAFARESIPAPQEGVTVTVVGERCIGQVDDTIMTWAVRLARVAEVEMLAVRFSGPEPDATFLGADPRPDLTSQETADAVIEHMAEKGEITQNSHINRRVQGIHGCHRSAG